MGIEVFLQGVGIVGIKRVSVSQDATGRDLVDVARQHGLQTDGPEQVFVFKEDQDEPLPLDTQLVKGEITPRSHVHVHCCRKIEVSVNFNGATQTHAFSPSATLAKVMKWTAKAFGMSEQDASEHALQLCNSGSRPSADTHVGTLGSSHGCSVCLDLVAKQRIEG